MKYNNLRQAMKWHGMRNEVKMYNENLLNPSKMEKTGREKKILIRKEKFNKKVSPFELVLMVKFHLIYS